MNIENLMVQYKGYGIRDKQEYEPKVLGVCLGCDNPVREDEDYVVNHLGVAHDERTCLKEYFRQI